MDKNKNIGILCPFFVFPEPKPPSSPDTRPALLCMLMISFVAATAIGVPPLVPTVEIEGTAIALNRSLLL
jgi:hypothetical protein